MIEAASNYPLASAIWTMFVFFAWVVWIWLLFTVFADLFRRKDVSGWGKAGWVVYMLVLPFIGVLTYLIVQGSAMSERQAAKLEAKSHQYGAGGSAPATNGQSAAEISHAKDLLDSGAINQDEYETLKRKALAG